ncbi:glycosyltransferase family 4 protein [Clostridium tyrobutyricum]|uniref:glycosyltransferase family 4 protein n=1 Tax=Clostridium tyrobutyricum TaxID=1519 RepID=UPI001C38049F|nr:glycosyltransferase family 4 protein [Clostridium tyrobutyricum]MBV4417259.1 glycosyltransferase family 4 protein [Clostridium tyrobutyricum]
MKTICLISPGILPIPNIYGGAIETLITNFIQQNEIYHKVNLIVISVYNSKAKRLSEKFKYTKILYTKKYWFDRFYSAIAHRLKKYFNIALSFKTLYYYRTYLYLKKVNPDYIIAEGGNYSDFKKISKYFGKEKVYLHIHHHLLPNRSLDNIFDNTISVSDFISKEWSNNSINVNLKSYIVYNCIDEEKFNKPISAEEINRIRQKLGIHSDDFVVIFCGRIIEVKGVKELIQAINLTKDSHIKLLIIGSPDFALNTKSDYLTEVTQLIKDAGEKIKFTGYVPNEQLYKYYQSADIQVVPSLWEEAAGLVLIEGMISGLPLIITKSGGMIEYVSTQCSIQLDRDEQLVDNIAQSILKLYCDNELCQNMSKESLKQAKKFSKHKFYLDLVNVFRED